jgi:hypothetical protein
MYGNKVAGNTEKTLNLSVNFHKGGYSVYTDFSGKEIYEYPRSIDIVNKNITVISRARGPEEEDREYIGKLTDKQYLKIREMVSALKKYDNSKIRRGPLGAWKCFLEIDNQFYYKYAPCSLFPFSHPEFSPMPEDIELLFKYIAGLIPISLVSNVNFFDLELKDKKTNPQPVCTENAIRE